MLTECSDWHWHYLHAVEELGTLNSNCEGLENTYTKLLPLCLQIQVGFYHPIKVFWLQNPAPVMKVIQLAQTAAENVVMGSIFTKNWVHADHNVLSGNSHLRLLVLQ